LALIADEDRRRWDVSDVSKTDLMPSKLFIPVASGASIHLMRATAANLKPKRTFLHDWVGIERYKRDNDASLS
jgi:hypothetical protein